MHFHRHYYSPSFHLMCGNFIDLVVVVRRWGRHMQPSHIPQITSISPMWCDVRHSAQFTTTLLCVFLQLLRPGPILASPAICIPPIKKRELGTIINFLWGSSNRPAAAVDFKFNDLITTTNDTRTSSEIPFCFFLTTPTSTKSFFYWGMEKDRIGERIAMHIS